jgi:DNA mismatch repair ATPase MutS
MRRDELIHNYHVLSAGYQLLCQREKRLLLILSLLRLGAFFGGITIIWVTFTIGTLWGTVSVAVFVSLFCFLLFSYSKHIRKRDFFNNLVIINENEASALSGNISIFGSGTCYIDKSHDFSDDIDLFGSDSLFQFLNRTCTENGSKILAGWLSDPLPLSKQLASRQEAIKELAENNKWYQEFLAFGLLSPIRNGDIEALLAWVGEKGDYKNRLFGLLTGYILPAITIISLLLLTVGMVHYSVFTSLFLINLLVVGSQLKKTNRIHNLVSKKYEFLSTAASLLEVVKNKSFSSSLLSEMRNELAGTSQSAFKSIKRLSRILQSFDSRMNMLIGFALNGLFLWDLQCVFSLQKWKSESKESLSGWLNVIGQIDALISIANFAFNNTDFVYPEKSAGEVVIKANSLGHPLIDEKRRVSNDFEILRPGSVHIITGANMAGKSTFLRTVAVNFILAMIGAPVCASAMTFLPMKIFSSMRTSDSLSQNESYFYAELKRLKELKIMLGKDKNVFFLLDEILKGTNSTDKSIGSKLFLEKIILLGGTGIIATHDISLGELEKTHRGKVHNQCFEIDIDGEKVSFDYKLRKGITQKMNAALLMKQMGITD